MAPREPSPKEHQWLQRQIQTLLQQDSADKARQEKIKVIQARIAAIGTELERIQTEIARIEGPDKERLAAARLERLDVYVAFFQNLKQEQRTLEELYAPVKTRLSSPLRRNRSKTLSFHRWKQIWINGLKRGSVLFDQRKTIPYGTMQASGMPLHESSGRPGPR